LTLKLNNRPNVAQTATALRIANLTGALTRLDAAFDFLDYRTLPRRQELSADRSRAVAETVADRHGIIIRLFLMHWNADLIFSKGLEAIGAKVDYRTIGGAAKQVGHIAQSQVQPIKTV